jgi:hypothetical protein
MKTKEDTHMVPNRAIKDYMAIGLREQIESLAEVLQEMDGDPLKRDNLAWRLKAIEQDLGRIREAA